MISGVKLSTQRLLSLRVRRTDEGFPRGNGSRGRLKDREVILWLELNPHYSHWGALEQGPFKDDLCQNVKKWQE